MRNIILQRLATCQAEELQGAEWISVEPRSGNGNVFCYNNGIVYQINHTDLQITKQYSLSTFFPAESTPELVDMTYNCLLSALYMVFVNGDIIMLEDGEDNFQFVGDVPNGVQAMEWSPGDEFLVLVTTDNKVILMASSFDTVHEVNLHEDGFGQNMFVTVGWGKKETQFHGSEGKAAAKMTTQVAPNPAFAWDDKKPRIRWRGDSEYFAISYIDNCTQSRTIRVFNRHGVLQSTSEVLPGMEQALDWKPSGNVLASTQRLPNKHIVVFLEKNGLKHGEFTLPFAPNEVKVIKLLWNSESSILAVWCEGLEESTNICSLQLWAASNYHWHIKQTLSFPRNQKLSQFFWDKDRANCLHVLQAGGKYTEYSFNWSVNNSSGVTCKDAASVAVVDGYRVKMSNFRESVVPPPMCSYSLTLPSVVTSVVFASKFNVNQATNDVCVVMDNAVAIFSQNAVEGLLEGVGISIAEDGLGFSNSGVKLYPESLHALEWSDEAKNGCYFSTPLGLHHWTWLQPHILLCVAPARGAHSQLLIVELKDKKAVIRPGPEVEDCVLHMEILPGGKDVVVFTERVFLHWVDPAKDGKLQPFKTTRCDFLVPPRCCKYTVVDVEGETFVIGLNGMGHLFIDETIAVKSCTSFFVHSEFLLLTNVQLQLLCIPRTKKALELLQKQGQAEVGTERQIERGARLVVAVPCNTRVVLQMPRGNLETIQPRALALYIVQNLLDQTKFSEAFDLMRRQRINLNVFYDHNPKLFLENIKQFINQVENPTWLCLFISDLMESDVTQSMYAGHYLEHVPANPMPGVSKLDIVCNKMRQILNEIDEERLLLPVITTHIKQSVPNIGAALECIRRARMLEQTGNKLAVSSDEALNYLFYIVDVYELFDVALGLYDFDLVMMVAAKSQKDPKEYLPFLNELRKLEINYQRFTIDKHLKKYESALHHLSLCANQYSEECLAFIKSHKLYSAALKIFARSHTLFECVCKNYAEALIAEGKYIEAGIMFGRSNSYVQAAEAFKKAGAWRKVLSIVPKLQLSDDELTTLYKELAHSLRDQRQFTDSAAVFGEYLHDTEERVVSLCMGRAWDEALRVTTSHNLPALVDTLIKSGVMDHYDSVLALLSTWQRQLAQYSARLLVVREEKARRLEEEGDELPPHPDCDMFSDTSSIGGSTKSRGSSASSRGTGKTYRSSKNKRKHERKLLSLKEGSAYEDLALVRALHEIFSKAYQMRDEVHSLCLVLLHFEMDVRAAELQTQLSTLLTSMQSKQPDIWIPELAQSRALALKTLGPDSTSNSLAAMQIHPANLVATAELEPHLCLPPTMQHNSWKLGVLS